MSVTSKESSRCSRPWPAASRLVKTIRRCLTDQECRIAVEHVNDIPVNEPWPACILAETWHVKLFSKLATLFSLKGQTRAHFQWSRRNDHRVIFAVESIACLCYNSPTRFSLHLRALKPSRVVCARFFGQLPRLMRRAIRRVIDVVLRNDSRSWNPMLYSKSLNYDVLYWCFE